MFCVRVKQDLLIDLLGFVIVMGYKLSGMDDLVQYTPVSFYQESIFF
jgi:hypothetical protein